MTAKSIWDRSYLFLIFISLYHNLPPLLYFLISLGNNLYTKYIGWIHHRIETILPEELEAQNIILLAELKLDNIF